MAITTGYTNNVNVVSIGVQHNVTLYTDRPTTPGAGDGHTKTNQTMAGTPEWSDGELYSAPGSGSFNP